MNKEVLSRFVTVLAFVSLAVLNWYCGKNVQPESRTSYAGLSDSAKYVGMQTCAGCHTGVHSTFLHTGMGRSFDLATKKKSAADFSGHPQVYDKFRDFYYHPFWQNDTLRFLEFRLEGKDTVYSKIQTVDYIVGSGQHTNSHMWQQNGYVFQAPLTFYTQSGKWDLPPGFEDGNNTRFGRMIGQECMTCHNAYPKFVAGSENKYAKIERGIDCERCHGPGSIHVQEKSAGILVDTAKYIDYSIVNPAKLPLDLQLDICQRCHIQGNAVVRPGKSFFDFKPGMRLSDVMDVYMPVYAGSEDEHIMASHAERLRMSRCFTASLEKIEREGAASTALKPYKNAMTCVTCHNPHVSVKETGISHFNATCNSCHAKPHQLCTLPETHRIKKQNDCVSCHMPLNNTTDIPHVSVHDHRIAVHLENKRVNAVKTFAGINCINNSSPDRQSIAEAYLNYAEKFGMGPAMIDSALKYLSPVSNPGKDASLLVLAYYLRKDWANVVKASAGLEQRKNISSVFDTRDAWTAYRVGEAYEQMGNNPVALNWYKKAFERLPHQPQFRNKFAGSLLNNNQPEAAFREFEMMTVEHPYFAPGFNNYGYLLLTLRNDADGALRNYNKALELDPDYSSAVINKAGWYLYRGDKKSAVSILKKHLPHAGDKPGIEQLLRQVEKSS